ncbi:MAG: MarR family transcriptional regulator [Gemmatimonadetes bacterium]|nr:MAG: MarR family transcriptional regulator [Gemmatimonadota bacterium]
MARRTRITEEIRQTRPFPTRGQEALVALLRTSDRVRRYLDTVVQREGLTAQQYNVLRILRGAGPGGLPTLEIAERMIERTPGVTRLVDRLVDEGYVRRERCERDRRIVYCAITPEGLAVLERLDGPVDAADRLVMRDLDDEAIACLIDALDAMRASLAAGEIDDGA